MHELAGGDRKNFIAYDEYVKKVLGGEDRTELRTRAAPPPPKRTADDIIKDLFNDIFHISPEAVNCSEIWFIAAGDPHEIDIFTESFGDLTGRIDLL